MTEPGAPAAARPLLVFDGDCGFCRYWVRYWRRMTGERVHYVAFQDLGQLPPGVTVDDLRRAIHLFEPDGSVSRGAEAAFRVLARAPSGGFWRRCYERVPGFAACAERTYAFIAAHRIGAARVARWLWGAERFPASYALARWLFLRGLGLVYVAAFWSFAVQITGLVGERGILPLGVYLEAVAEHYGARAWWELPSFFWLAASDSALLATAWSGVALGIAIALGRCERSALVLAWLAYLSLFYAGQVFTTFQWDLLLLEAGFLAMFLPGGGPRLPVLLYRWLLFRFMFGAGFVKIASGDPSWRDLSALEYHFETQPLPTVLAWYAHHLPEVLLRIATGATLAIELLLPFAVFMPRRPRLVAAWGFIVLQLAILATGNYNYFNLLALLLCLFLFDDRALGRLVPGILAHRAPRPASGRWTPARAATVGAALLVLPASAIAFGEQIALARAPEWLRRPAEILAPLRIANSYGVFAVMTTTRHEIIVEGSDDRREWRAYPFRYKPGDPQRAPPWNVPHQPRLDWQMWFAALSDAGREPWFERLLERLLEGSPPVLALLAGSPFDDGPPRYVRALIYRYRFSTPEERAATGAWWQREAAGVYYPVLGTRITVEPIGPAPERVH